MNEKKHKINKNDDGKLRAEYLQREGPFILDENDNIINFKY